MAILKIESEAERIILMLVTGLSNLPAMIPLMTVMRKQSYFHLFAGYFAMCISIAYHCCEALPSQRFILHEGNWHRLDNVGAITGFTLLMIYLMDISHYPNLRAFFELSQFGITLIIQERAPWNLENTLVPILFWAFACLIKHTFCYFMYGTKPNYHWGNLRIGISTLLFASIFFALGLDDENDYLRLYHSAWHLFVTIGSYWLWQIVETENDKEVGKMV